MSMRLAIRPVIFLILTASLLLNACEKIFPDRLPDSAPTLTPVLEQKADVTDTLNDNSNSELAISDPTVLKMLYSHVNWDTLWIDAIITNFSQGNPIEEFTHVQAWVDSSQAQFRVLSGLSGGSPDTLQISDGNKIQTYDLITGNRQEWMINPNSLEPFNPPEMFSDTIYPHPLGQQIFTPISDLLFPTALAQRTGFYAPAGSETVADRATDVIEFSRVEGSLTDRLWVDQETGIILKRQAYDKSGNGTLNSEYEIRKIELGIHFPESAFSLDVVQAPVFSESSDRLGYGPTLTFEEAQPKEASPYGEIFFVSNVFGELQLMRLPADCLILETSCPPAETVPGYPNQNESINPLIWSASGEQAALVVNDRLYVYTPASDQWLLLLRADSFYPPLWSPDGQWLAYVAREDDHLQLALIRPDGSEQRSLSEGKDLSTEVQMEVLDWEDSNHLIISTFAPGQRHVYRVDVENADWTSLEVPEMALKDYQIYDPHGEQIARVNYTSQGTRLAMAIGNHEQEIINLSNASIWPVVWSPDGQYLAFNTYTADINEGAQVFVYDTTGFLGLRQMYRGDMVFSIHWSPTSPVLLLETDQAGVSILVVAVLPTGSYRSLVLEGINPSAQISGVSWRPVDSR